MPSTSEPTRILIAGGNKTDIECFRALLSELGHDLQTATDGFDAMECVRQFAPHLILLDSMLPKVNGFEVCKHLKADPSTSRIMVLMVTTLNELGDIERAVAVGTDDFLTKPVDKTELLKRVGHLLELQTGMK